MTQPRNLTMIPIDHIRVVNSRSRDKKKFSEISNSIKNIGIKMPINLRIAEQRDGIQYYDLTCGQGRVESFIKHNQEEIPALLNEDTEKESLLKSLIENMARTSSTATEQFSEICALKKRGYTISAISRKVDLDLEFTRGVVHLIENGEAKLLNAVAAKRIPITLAMNISKLKEGAIQEAIAELFTQKKLDGKAVEYAIRLVQQRKIGGKGTAGGAVKRRVVTAESFKEEFDREIAKQQKSWQDLKLSEARLHSLEDVMRRLIKDDNFITMLRAENLNQIPETLAKAVGTHG